MTKRAEGSGEVAVRGMTPDDVPAGVRLKNIAGWNQTPDDWRLFLAANPAGCFVAESAGDVVGTVASVDYAGLVAWIGMVLVHPDHRRKGIGTRLLETAIDGLQGCETIKLDATPAGKKLYDSLGFVDEYGLTRMVVEELPEAPRRAPGVRRLAPGRMAEALDLDLRAFGVDRGPVIKSLLGRMPGLGWVLEEGGRVRALCVGRDGERLQQVGPVVAEDAESAAAVAGAALSALQGQGVVMDVPDAQTGFIEWLEGLGFRRQRGLMRMYRGPNGHPGMAGLQFAITGPELG